MKRTMVFLDFIKSLKFLQNLIQLLIHIGSDVHHLRLDIIYLALKPFHVIFVKETSLFRRAVIKRFRASLYRLGDILAIIESVTIVRAWDLPYLGLLYTNSNCIDDIFVSQAFLRPSRMRSRITGWRALRQLAVGRKVSRGIGRGIIRRLKCTLAFSNGRKIWYSIRAVILCATGRVGIRKPWHGTVVGVCTEFASTLYTCEMGWVEGSWSGCGIRTFPGSTQKVEPMRGSLLGVVSKIPCEVLFEPSTPCEFWKNGFSQST